MNEGVTSGEIKASIDSMQVMYIRIHIYEGHTLVKQSSITYCLGLLISYYSSSTAFEVTVLVNYQLVYTDRSVK